MLTVFGLTIEKLFVVAPIAAVIIGPRRLPAYAGRLGRLIRRVTVLAGDAARRVEHETGVTSIREDWTALDPRQYDPRRIIREAWAAGDSAAVVGSGAGLPSVDETDAVEAAAEAPVASDGAWVVTGSSAHPRRVWVPAES